MVDKFKFISLNKSKVQRGYTYISAFGIPFLVARELGEIFPKLHWVLLFLAAIIGIWIIGHIDLKKGFWGYEMELAFKNNPEWKRQMHNKKEDVPLNENKPNEEKKNKNEDF